MNIYGKNIKTKKIFKPHFQKTLTNLDIIWQEVSNIEIDLAIPVHRPYLLGNPYSHLDVSKAEFEVNSRQEAISKYKDYFHSNEKFKANINFIVEQLKGNLVCCLECFCLPQDCHIRIITEYIYNSYLNSEIRES